MTKKDYVRIAEVLRRSRQTLVEGTDIRTSLQEALFWRIVRDLADTLAQENPRFQQAKFYDYINEQ